MLAVKRVVDNVGLFTAQRRHQLFRGVQRNHFVTCFGERVTHELAAFQREFAFEGLTAHENRNFKCHFRSFL